LTLTALAFVIDVNLHRRHLNESQRAMVGAKLSNIKHGGDRKSINQETNLALDISQADAAKLLNVSTGSIKTAKQVQQNAVPELAEQVSQGNISVSAYFSVLLETWEAASNYLAFQNAKSSVLDIAKLLGWTLTAS